MPSSWSASLRFELQFTGSNINIWGDKLNVDLSHVDYAIAGLLTKALTVSPYTLTVANSGDDESRAAMLKFTGAGPFTVVIPSVTKSYLVWNGCTGVVTMTTGAGAVVAIDPGDVVTVFCDAMGARTPGYSGLSIKDYIAAAVIGATGSLPGAIGNEGKALVVQSGMWAPKQLQTTDIADYQAETKKRALLYSLIF